MEKKLQDNITKYQQQYKLYQSKYQQITLVRFVVFFCILVCLYFYFKYGGYYLLIPVLLGIIAFLWLLKIDATIIDAKKKYKVLLQINENELSFLTTNKSNYNNGEAYVNASHLYANDLDIFGNNSLYQYLNRTATVMGATSLSSSLLAKQSLPEIVKMQEAVKECSDKTDFRQEIFALATLAEDDEAKYKKIIEWSKTDFKKIPNLVNLLLFILPVVLLTVIIVDNVSSIPNLHWVAIFLFLMNAYITSLYGKQLTKIIGSTEKVNETIHHYSKIIETVEKNTFSSIKMQELKGCLKSEGGVVSKKLSKLASIIANIETIQNVFGALIVNGFTFFHLHQLNALNKWKNNYNASMESWFAVIGEIEKINSLANFSANNPQFCFPSIVKEEIYSFENLGHPLIHPDKRVCNSVNLVNQNFMILSGSNMSGKSTFLRTVGVNIVLLNAGAPICATNAAVSHLDMVSCMRLSDSLEENESYFFAEVKRLQQIMEVCKINTCFVLLDEILRGTNSEDKKQGTIQVIQKLLKLHALGIIATHDIEVCNWGKTANSAIGLNCFENDIINNELYFDYKLKAGICKNKTASFLLEKMSVTT